MKRQVSFADMVDEARRSVEEVMVDRVWEMLQNGERPLLLDVREREEFQEGFIEGAVNLPRGFLELRIEGIVGDRSTPVLVYCAMGDRSLLAAKVLKEMGYRRAASVWGGFDAWRSAGYPVKRERSLSPEELQRYSRHLMLPEVGEQGQKRLLEAKVLLVGAGGLGSPATMYLAAAGVGTLGVIDGDVVDLTNLQRQILHGTPDVGRSKAESARETILEMNPGCDVRIYRERLTAENAMDLLADYDLVVDGCDNFPTRYLVNDACVLAGKPNVHGSIFRFEGQATVFAPGRGPCYRCIFPDPPPPGMVPG